MTTNAKGPFTPSVSVDPNVGASVDALVSIVQFTPSITVNTCKKNSNRFLNDLKASMLTLGVNTV